MSGLLLNESEALEQFIEAGISRETARQYVTQPAVLNALYCNDLQQLCDAGVKRGHARLLLRGSPSKSATLPVFGSSQLAPHYKTAETQHQRDHSEHNKRNLSMPAEDNSDDGRPSSQMSFYSNDSRPSSQMSNGPPQSPATPTRRISRCCCMLLYVPVCWVRHPHLHCRTRTIMQRIVWLFKNTGVTLPVPDAELEVAVANTIADSQSIWITSCEVDSSKFH